MDRSLLLTMVSLLKLLSQDAVVTGSVTNGTAGKVLHTLYVDQSDARFAVHRVLIYTFEDSLSWIL